MKLHLPVMVLSCALTACAFFEEPVENFDLLPVPSNSTPEPSLPDAPVQSDENTQQTPTRSATATTASSDGPYFTFVSLFDVPEDSKNISFIHFTDRNTRRESAMCEALIEKYQVTAAADVPENAAHLIVWPVRGEKANSNCKEMVAEYEAVDISNKTAEKVSSETAGPYLLSRNSAADKRLIYDLSAAQNRALGGSLDGWQSIVEGAATGWPPYQSAE